MASNRGRERKSPCISTREARPARNASSTACVPNRRSDRALRTEFNVPGSTFKGAPGVASSLSVEPGTLNWSVFALERPETGLERSLDLLITRPGGPIVAVGARHRPLPSLDQRDPFFEFCHFGVQTANDLELRIGEADLTCVVGHAAPLSRRGVSLGDQAAGYANHGGIRRHVLGDHRAGADDGAVADRD